MRLCYPPLISATMRRWTLKTTVHLAMTRLTSDDLVEAVSSDNEVMRVLSDDPDVCRKDDLQRTNETVGCVMLFFPMPLYRPLFS